jgi:hypothetical protein
MGFAFRLPQGKSHDVQYGVEAIGGTFLNVSPA